VAAHEGGHTPFSADVTPFLREGENALVMRAEDPSRDTAIPISSRNVDRQGRLLRRVPSAASTDPGG
jgi:hypothetical protein